MVNGNIKASKNIMPINSQGYWVPNLFPKQFEIFNCNKRYLLVSGPRKSGKTLGVLHKVVRHLWETDRARVAVVSKTLKSAKEGGVWSDMHDIVLPEWYNSNIGMENTTGEGKQYKLDQLTKTPSFSVTNYHGTESEVLLFSIDNPGSFQEVEAKLKSTRFSMIYFSELSNFPNKNVFAVSLPQLRMFHLARNQHMWMADTNPSEEGESSWIYQLFYQERLAPNHPRPKFQEQLSLIEIFWEDNPYFTQDDKEEILASCEYDSELFERYAKGLWTKGGMKSRVFANLYRPAVHVIGSCIGEEKDWQVALPSENCTTLLSGWDTGDNNHAAVIMEKIDTAGDDFIFVVLDELVYLRQQISLEAFTLEFMEKMDKWEQTIGRHIEWRHWCDEAMALNWKAGAASYDSLIIQAVSNNRITLDPYPTRGEKHSVKSRAIMLRRLLSARRIVISASCAMTLQMLTELRLGKSDSEYIPRADPNKHVFDALTYCVGMETVENLSTGKINTGNTGSNFIMVRGG